MIELTGIRGMSAWLVYNKVIFALPFITENRAASRPFSRELARGVALETVEELREFIAGLNVETMPRLMTQAEAVGAFKTKGERARQLALLECMTHSSLSDDEVMRLLAVHKDGNGIPYGKANIANLSTSKASELMLDTLLACSMVDVDLSLVSSAELDDLGGKRLDIKNEAVDLLAQGPNLSVGELLSLAIKRCLGNIMRKEDGRRS